MKQKSNSKRLIVALSLALVLMLAIGGIVGLETAPVAQAEGTLPEEVTYFSGIRSSTVNTIYLYWRLDGASLGSPSATGIAVDWYSQGSETPTTKYLKLSYTTVSALNKNNQGSTILRANAVYTRKDTSVSPEVVIFDDTTLKDKAPAIKIDWFSDADCKNKFNAVAGDSFTLKSGTAISSESAKHVTNQDYTFNFGGSDNSWTLSEDTHIPVGFDGWRSGSATEIYAYGPKKMDNYIYASNTVYNGNNSQGYTVLNNEVKMDYYASASASPVELTGEIQLQLLSVENGSFKPCVRIVLNTTAAVGGHVVIRKGTIFDNYIVDRDYTFYQIATTGRWYMSAQSLESDPTMTLTSRANNLKDGSGLYLFTTSELPFEADERFAKWTPIDVNGTTTYINYMGGLTKSGNNYSFYIKFHSKVAEGSIVTLPKGMFIAGYRLANTHYFKYNNSTDGWTLITCDTVNHVYDDDFTCHDRVCACGHVENATTDHAFESGSFVCSDRVCTTCKDTVKGSGHTFENPNADCVNRVCTICSQTILASGEHNLVSGDTCTSSCSKCGATGVTVHTFPQAPEGGWASDNDTVTVTTAPDCTTEGAGTVKCEKCDATDVVVVNALGHSVPTGEKYCERDCGYRVPYTADDMDEVLALDDLVAYKYSDAHAEDANSTMGTITATSTANGFLINSTKTDEGYIYDEGKNNVHNMTVEFTLNLTSWASKDRSHFVYLMAHENGWYGIGFHFILRDGTTTLRVNYKSKDGNDGYRFVEPVTLTGIALNAEQRFKLGAVQNDDGSFFVFAYYNGNLLFTGHLTKDILSANAYEANHDGLGGAVGFRFNGSDSGPSINAKICDVGHVTEGERHNCKTYICELCGGAIASTTNHTLGDAVATGGSCTVKQTLTRTCSVCDDTVTSEGDYVHTWDTENPITVSPAQCNNTDKVVKYNCSGCDAQSDNQTVSGSGYAGGHTYSYAVATPATCVAGGTDSGTCTKCGHTTTMDSPIDPDGHAYGTEIAKVAETCSTAGTLAYYECSLCDKLFVREGDNYVEKTASQLVIPAGHKYQSVAEDPATCTENGTLAHYSCSDCDKLFVKEGDNYVEKTASQLVILAGHNYVDGVCSVCQAEDNLYFFNQAISSVTSATSAEAKFNALKVAIAKYNLLSSEEKASNQATLDAQISAYNTMATQANQAHGKQTDNVATILGWLTSVTAMAVVALVLKKIIR